VAFGLGWNLSRYGTGEGLGSSAGAGADLTTSAVGSCRPTSVSADDVGSEGPSSNRARGGHCFRGRPGWTPAAIVSSSSCWRNVMT
jgi:hypothetical protein